MSDAVGMMNEAYFVSRGELIAWLNNLLQLNYTKVEQACSASAYCQLMDALYPGQVPLHKVNFNAKLEHEFVANFKILQSLFDKFGIDRHIEVAKLVKGKYLDNLEFMQWMKRYYDTHASGLPYDAVRRRQEAAAVRSKRIGGAALAEMPPASVPTPAAPVASAPAPAAPAATKPAAASKPSGIGAASTKSAAPTVAAAAATGELSAKMRELQQQAAEMKLTIDNLEKERDFYFGKLRDIEILCQQVEGAAPDLIKAIEKILYATDEDFAPPTA